MTYVLSEVRQRVNQRPGRGDGLLRQVAGAPRCRTFAPRVERGVDGKKRSALRRERIDGRHESGRVIHDDGELRRPVPAGKRNAHREAQPRACAVQGVGDEHREPVGVLTLRAPVQLVR